MPIALPWDFYLKPDELQTVLTFCNPDDDDSIFAKVVLEVSVKSKRQNQWIWSRNSIKRSGNS